jgi:hypothetical protein
LVNWAKDGAAFTGTGAATSWPLIQQPTTTPRKFLRIQSGHAATDFPPTIP